MLIFKRNPYPHAMNEIQTDNTKQLKNVPLALLLVVILEKRVS